jgi:hypothetical protein
MNINEVDLHDALLKNMVVDYKDKTISIFVDYYKSENDKERITAEIRFKGVEMLSQVSDTVEMERNAFAGNISYWIPSQGSGTTYIYLSQGFISVKSNDMQFV